jgi:hypothetical protein
MAVVLTVTSDTHCGSTIGLMSPKPITYDDGGEYHPSPGQRWLWERWMAGWDAAGECAVRNNAEHFWLLNGDLTDGPLHHGTHQSISALHTQEREVVRDVLDYPLLNHALRKIFLIRGTESHVGKGACSEEGIAKALSDDWPVEPCAENGTMSWWHLMADIEGVLIDALHHGRTGYRPWTFANAVNLLAAQIVMERVNNNERIPDLALRAHFHRYNDSYGAQRTRVIQGPAFQLSSSYVHRKVPESLADIGMYWILIDDGHYELHKSIEKPSRGRIWTAA